MLTSSHTHTQNTHTHTHTLAKANAIWDMETAVGHRQIQRTRKGMLLLFFKKRGWLKGAIITDKGLISQIYKLLMEFNINIKKINNSI